MSFQLHVNDLSLEELHSVRICGRAYQNLGAEFEKSEAKQFLHVSHPHFECAGMTECDKEQRGLAVSWQEMSSWKYCGAVPLKQEKKKA